MKIETLNKGIKINDDIIRERKILSKIDKLHTLSKSKELTSEDIKYLIERAHEGVSYILTDLKKQMEQLAD